MVGTMMKHTAVIALAALVGCKGSQGTTTQDAGTNAGPDLGAIPTGAGWHCSAEYENHTTTRSQCFRSLATCDDDIEPARIRFNADEREAVAEREAARARARAEAAAQLRPSDLTVARTGTEPREPPPEQMRELSCAPQTEAHCMTWRDVAMNVTRFYCGASEARCRGKRRELEESNQASTSVVRYRDLSPCAAVQ